MNIRLVVLPFHCLFPKAPARFAGYTATVPVYDPGAPDRTKKAVWRAMRLGIDAALACERNNKWRPRALPRSVYLPVATEYIVRRQNGSGEMKFLSRSRTSLGFRRFTLEDLATTPFQEVKSAAVPKALAEQLKSLVGG